MKTCSKCKESKDYNSYYKEKAKPDGYGRYCKQCSYIEHQKRKHKYPYYKSNLKETKTRHILSIQERRAKQREYMKKRLNNVDCRILHNIRSRFYRAVKKEYVKGKTIENLGCSIPEFKEYMSNKFTEGMSWDNYGKWEIDHIVPLSSAKSVEEAWKLSHYTNLQPLWKADNIRKRNKAS